MGQVSNKYKKKTDKFAMNIAQVTSGRSLVIIIHLRHEWLISVHVFYDYAPVLISLFHMLSPWFDVCCLRAVKVLFGFWEHVFRFFLVNCICSFASYFNSRRLAVSWKMMKVPLPEAFGFMAVYLRWWPLGEGILPLG